MINIDPKNLSQLVYESEDYKILEKGRWLYIVPVEAVTDAYVEEWDDAHLIKIAVIVVNPAGQVAKSRYGAVYSADEDALDFMQYR